MRFLCKKFARALGQTSIEYLMVIFVVALVATTAFKLIKERWLKSDSSIMNKLLSTFSLESESSSGSNNNSKFKTFKLKQ